MVNPIEREYLASIPDAEAANKFAFAISVLAVRYGRQRVIALLHEAIDDIQSHDTWADIPWERPGDPTPTELTV